MSIEHLDASTTGDDVAKILARDGVVVVDALVAGSVMDKVQDELAPFLDTTPFGPDDFTGRRTRRTGGLVARSATCALGYVDDLRDPIEVLRTDAKTAGFGDLADAQRRARAQGRAS